MIKLLCLSLGRLALTGALLTLLLVSISRAQETNELACPLNGDICGRDLDKVFVCHSPPGNPSKARTLCIDPEDAVDHMDHGDDCGECESIAILEEDDCGPPYTHVCGDGCCDPGECPNEKKCCVEDC